jgi:virginiamycin B lyase
MRAKLALMAIALATLPAWAPGIVEFGPSFRSELRGIALAPDGAVWVEETDGAARISRDGKIREFRRADDCGYCAFYQKPGIGIGPGGAVWSNGGDRLLRFDGRGVRAYGVLPQPPPNSAPPLAYAAFAATRDAVYAGLDDGEPGIRRIAPDGAWMQVLADSGSASAVQPAGDGVLWLEILESTPAGANPSLTRHDRAGTVHGVAREYFAAHALKGATAAEPDGSLLAAASADDTHSAVVRVTAGSNVATLATVPDTGYRDTIGSIAVGADRSVWFTEPNAARVARISKAGALREYRRGLADGSVPSGIAVDRDGSAWFADAFKALVQHITVDGSVRTIGNGLLPRNSPATPAVTSDGAAWFYETFSWHPRIARIAPDGTIREFPLPLEFPAEDVAPYPAGNDVIVFGSNDWVGPVTAVRLSPDGATRREPRNACVAALVRECLPQVPEDTGAPKAPIFRDADGTLWFADPERSAIGRVSVAGRVSYFTRGLTRWNSGPQYLTRGPDGALWFTEVRGRIGRLAKDGTISEFSRGIPTRSFLGGIVAGCDGNVWFTLYHGNELGRITPGGLVTRFRDGIYPSSGNDDSVPDSIPVTDQRGRIWFNEPQGGRIARATLRCKAPLGMRS